MDKVIALENKINFERQKDAYAKKSKFIRGFDKVMQVLGVRRIIQTAVDSSIPFRQGATLISPANIGVWLKGFSANFKGMFSSKNYERMMYQIRKDPQYHEKVKDGIVFNDIHAADPTLHNEDFQKSFVYKIPIISEPLKASNRAADGFLNIARDELYNKFRARLEAQGITRQSDPKAYTDMAKWVMNMTGRGNLMSAFEHDKAQRLLGNTFYGARLMASRFNMLNPATYIKMTPAMRQEAIADITSWVGTTMAIGYGLYQAGAQISLNPDDSDFLQARFGNKVYDVSGGTANYVRTYLRLTNAVYDKFNPKTTKYESNKSTEFGAMSAVKFLNNKLAPNTRYVSDLFFNKDFAPSDIVAMYPMYAPEVIKSFQEDGVVSFATVLAPNLLGVGYGNYHTRDEIDTDLDELKKGT